VAAGFTVALVAAVVVVFDRDVAFVAAFVGATVTAPSTAPVAINTDSRCLMSIPLVDRE
jgi:hypothetical protein